MLSGGVRFGPVGSDWVISHTAQDSVLPLVTEYYPTSVSFIDKNQPQHMHTT